MSKACEFPVYKLYGHRLTSLGIADILLPWSSEYRRRYSFQETICFHTINLIFSMELELET